MHKQLTIYKFWREDKEWGLRGELGN